jgi:hypothetical protein
MTGSGGARPCGPCLQSKLKTKLYLCLIKHHAMKTCEGLGLNTRQSLLPRGRTPVPLGRRLGEPQNRYGHAKDENLFSLPGFKPRFLSRSASGLVAAPASPYFDSSCLTDRAMRNSSSHIAFWTGSFIGLIVITRPWKQNRGFRQTALSNCFTWPQHFSALK